MKKGLLYFFFCIYTLFPSGLTRLSAQEQKDIFGGWEYIGVSYSIPNSNWSTSILAEHHNIEYRELDLFMAKVGADYQFSKWLKVGAAYEFLLESEGIGHRPFVHLTGSLKKGNLTVSIRERYQHKWSEWSSTVSNELRSRLKVQYAIADSRFRPYLATEVFTWKKWLKTRYYAGTAIRLNSTLELDAYYMYYVFSGKPAEHVIGLGLNVSL